MQRCKKIFKKIGEVCLKAVFEGGLKWGAVDEKRSMRQKERKFDPTQFSADCEVGSGQGHMAWPYARWLRHGKSRRQCLVAQFRQNLDSCVAPKHRI